MVGLGVEGLMSGVQGMRIRGGKAENLEKRGCRKKVEEKSKTYTPYRRMGHTRRKEDGGKFKTLED
jgi:hypothetical protein